MGALVASLHILWASSFLQGERGLQLVSWQEFSILHCLTSLVNGKTCVSTGSWCEDPYWTIESPGSAGIFTANVLSNIIVRQDSPHQRLRVQICAGNGHKILLTDYERPRGTCATGSSFNCGLQTFPVLWHISDVSHLPAGIIKYITPGLSLNWSNRKGIKCLL